MRIRWSEAARLELNDIVAWLISQSDQAAARILDEIEGHINFLGDFPRGGREGRITGTRELPVLRTPYVIGYRIEDTVIEILTIRHGARQWPSSFDEPA